MCEIGEMPLQQDPPPSNYMDTNSLSYHSNTISTDQQTEPSTAAQVLLYILFYVQYM